MHPGVVGIKDFCIDLSKYLFKIMYWSQQLCTMVANNLLTHDVRAIGRSLEGTNGSFSAFACHTNEFHCHLPRVMVKSHFYDHSCMVEFPEGVEQVSLQPWALHWLVL